VILRKGGEGLQSKEKVFQRCCRWFGLLFIWDCKRTFGDFDHGLRYHDISLRKQKKFGLGAGFRPPFSGWLFFWFDLRKRLLGAS